MGFWRWRAHDPAISVTTPGAGARASVPAASAFTSLSKATFSSLPVDLPCLPTLRSSSRTHSASGAQRSRNSATSATATPADSCHRCRCRRVLRANGIIFAMRSRRRLRWARYSGSSSAGRPVSARRMPRASSSISTSFIWVPYAITREPLRHRSAKALMAKATSVSAPLPLSFAVTHLSPPLPPASVDRDALRSAFCPSDM